jgi:hypothetical protein
MNSILLDRSTWDLVIDAQNNIAVCSNPYAIAQDAASAIRLFKGECWYDTTRGVPHFQEILGHQPSLSILKSALQTAALTVPETETAVVFISSVANREVQGQVQITSTSGATTVVAGPFNVASPV